MSRRTGCGVNADRRLGFVVFTMPPSSGVETLAHPRRGPRLRRPPGSDMRRAFPLGGAKAGGRRGWTTAKAVNVSRQNMVCHSWHEKGSICVFGGLAPQTPQGLSPCAIP
jgi:hypothetical protein